MKDRATFTVLRPARKAEPPAAPANVIVCGIRVVAAGRLFRQARPLPNPLRIVTCLGGTIMERRDGGRAGICRSQVA